MQYLINTNNWVLKNLITPLPSFGLSDLILELDYYAFGYFPKK